MRPKGGALPVSHNKGKLTTNRRMLCIEQGPAMTASMTAQQSAATESPLDAVDQIYLAWDRHRRVPRKQFKIK